MAVADYLHDPEVRERNLGAWTSHPGQTIRVTAVDDVEVRCVVLTIADDDGHVVVSGEARKDTTNPLHQLSTTTGTLERDKAIAIATAYDLPGHESSSSGNQANQQTTSRKDGPGWRAVRSMDATRGKGRGRVARDRG